MKDFILGLVLIIISQTLIWYQTNGQFKWTWFAENPLMVASIFSIPISYCFITANKYVVAYFGGQLWPARFIGFAVGMITFALLTSVYMDQGITAKTLVSLILAAALVLMQLL